MGLRSASMEELIVPYGNIAWSGMPPIAMAMVVRSVSQKVVAETANLDIRERVQGSQQYGWEFSPWWITTKAKRALGCH